MEYVINTKETILRQPQKKIGFACLGFSVIAIFIVWTIHAYSDYEASPKINPNPNTL